MTGNKHDINHIMLAKWVSRHKSSNNRKNFYLKSHTTNHININKLFKDIPHQHTSSTCKLKFKITRKLDNRAYKSNNKNRTKITTYIPNKHRSVNLIFIPLSNNNLNWISFYNERKYVKIEINKPSILFLKEL